MPQYDLEDIKRRAYAGEFSSTARQITPIPLAKRAEVPEQEPRDDEFSFIGAAGDLIAAPFRGAEGAIRSTYGLLDAITMDSLPDYKENVLGSSKYLTGQLLEGLTQFGVGFYTIGGALGAVGKGVKGAEFLLAAGEGAKGLSLAGNVARGVLTDFTVFDGQSGRLADLAAKIPGFEEPMNQYMSFALTNEDDNELIGRMKNALEGAGIGAAVDGVLRGVRWLKKIKQAEQAGKTPEVAVKEANAAVDLGDVNQQFRQLDDMKFADSTALHGQLLDDEILKAQTQDVWLNPDSWHTRAEVESVEIQPGRPVIEAPRAEIETLLKRNLEHEAATAADVLKRELDYDEKMTAAYLDNLRKSREQANPERAAAQAQVDGVLAKVSSRGRRKLASTPTGKSTFDIMESLRASGSERGVRGAKEIGVTPMTGAGTQSYRVILAEMKSAGSAMSRWELQNWLHKWGTMLDNPATTVHLRGDTAEIGVHLSPEQAADDAVVKALQALRCAGGV